MDFIEGKLIYSFFSTFNMIFVFTISSPIYLLSLITINYINETLFCLF